MARSSSRPRLVLDLPGPLAERLAFVRVLDGRPVTEWARGVLSAAVLRLLVDAPGWAWARPAAPWWREGGEDGAPAGALAGGERVLVLAVVGVVFEREADPDGDGLGLLADVVPAAEGPAAGVLRRVVLRASDVLPWRDRRGEPVPAGSPAALRAERRARASAAAEVPRERRPPTPAQRAALEAGRAPPYRPGPPGSRGGKGVGAPLPPAAPPSAGVDPAAGLV